MKWLHEVKEFFVKRPEHSVTYLGGVMPGASLAEVLVGLGLVVLIYGLFEFVRFLIPYTVGFAIPIVVALGGIVVASLLFALKLKYLGIYALTEIAFGVVSIGFAVSLMETDSQAWLKICAAIYLIARGLDNRANDKRARASKATVNPSPQA